jgi:hypothetical protein
MVIGSSEICSPCMLHNVTSKGSRYTGREVKPKLTVCCLYLVAKGWVDIDISIR